jgi:hypothetical protein
MKIIIGAVVSEARGKRKIINRLEFVIKVISSIFFFKIKFTDGFKPEKYRCVGDVFFSFFIIKTDGQAVFYCTRMIFLPTVSNVSKDHTGKRIESF